MPAASRKAAVRYCHALLAAWRDLLARLDALDSKLRTAEAADYAERLPRKVTGLVRAWPYLDAAMIVEQRAPRRGGGQCGRHG